MKRRSRVWPARIATAALFVAGAGAAGVACPSRNLDVDIDGNGVVTVVATCEAIGHVCDDKLTRRACDPIFCTFDAGHIDPDVGTCSVTEPCDVAGSGPSASYQSNTPTALQLVLLSTNPLSPQAVSPCVCFDSSDFVCPVAADGAVPTATDCWAASIDAKLGAGVPGGLTFSGFDSPDQAILAMAWFQPPATDASASDAACGDLPEGGTALCGDVANLVACAGLGAPPGTSTYDITCASCRHGVHEAIGNDNGPCPTSPGAGGCFLASCAAALFPP